MTRPQHQRASDSPSGAQPTFVAPAGANPELSPPQTLFSDADPLRLVAEVAADVDLAAGSSEFRKLVDGISDHEAWLHLAMEAGGLGAWRFDVPAQRVHWSRSLEAIHGIPEGSFAGTFEAYQSDMHPADRERVLATVDRTFREQRTEYLVEYRIIRPDGEVRSLHAQGRAFYDSEGAPLRMIGVCQDTTELRRADASLTFLAEASRVLGDSLDYEVTLATLAELIVPELADWCVIDLVQVTGSARRLAVRHRDPARVALAEELERRWPTPPDSEHGIPRALRTGEAELMSDVPDELLASVARDEDHLRILRALGLRSSLVVPIVGRTGVLGAIALVTAESGRRFGESDRTLALDLATRAATAVENARLFAEVQQQREEMEAQAEELQSITEELEISLEDAEKARHDAERANLAKSEFLAMMSHELRTPLNAIGGYTQLVLEEIQGPVTVAQETSLKRVQRNQLYLLGLINDVLNFARLEVGQLRLDLEPVALDAALRGLEELISPQVGRRGLRYEYREGPPGVHVMADVERLRQVILNLLGNSVKFTEPGGSLTLEWELDGASALIHVRDTGSGIPAGKLESIFDPFVQVGRTLHSGREGVGLGLAISRDLARAMNGEISVESVEGEGSTFTVRLPLLA